MSDMESPVEIMPSLVSLWKSVELDASVGSANTSQLPELTFHAGDSVKFPSEKSSCNNVAGILLRSAYALLGSINGPEDSASVADNINIMGFLSLSNVHSLLWRER
ncbi:hypothetical protein D3C76_1558770 [compost metagenome]